MYTCTCIWDGVGPLYRFGQFGSLLFASNILEDRVRTFRTELRSLASAKLFIAECEFAMAEGKEKEHTEVKCLICQENYDQGEELRRLPCQHCFHKECVDTWLSTKDTCAFCRKSIISE